MQIFVSYASEDRPVAESLAIALTQEGHDVFFDRSSLPAGDAFHSRIRAGIEAADLVVFLVSPDSVVSNGYARTELKLTQEKWKSPSGHVLPVIVRPTPLADVPAYLKAVTLLEPQGNTEAEVLARVARMRRTPWRRAIVALVAGLVVAGVAIAILTQEDDTADSTKTACFLDATIRPLDDRTAGTSLDQLAIETAYAGVSKAFLVSASGVARADVGPLTLQGSTWIITLLAPDGREIGRESVVGCPQTLRTLRISDRYEILLGPRSP